MKQVHIGAGSPLAGLGAHYWTPGNESDAGGKDTEGEAQDNNEAHFTLAGYCF